MLKSDNIVSYKVGNETFDYRKISSVIKDYDGTVIFERDDIEVPVKWSQTASDILAQKYFRKAGVPSKLEKVSEPGIFTDFSKKTASEGASLGGEYSAHQVFHRLAGCWTYWGIKSKYFTTLVEAKSFYEQCYYALYKQIGAPNSPQFFNTGLNWAYGITSDLTNTTLFHNENGKTVKSSVGYEHPAVHACFIQSIDDSLLNKGGIMDLFVREASVFKYGSGSGTNYSNVRGKNEKLAGGGTSSGLMSFLKIGDTAAGAIKSGGTTRRAAKMVTLDIDHPEIEHFISWKMDEENKVAALITGSKLNKKLINNIVDAKDSDDLDKHVAEAYKHNVPGGLIQRAIQAHNNKYSLKLEEFDTDWQSEAYQTVSGQNANNSVAVSDSFMRTLKNKGDWNLIARTDKSIMKTVKAEKIWNDIGTAAWCSADPGVMFIDMMNEWNTCLNDERIRGSNPCSEYLWFDDTACNLASLNLVALMEEAEWDMDKYSEQIVTYSKLFTLILDISIEMAQFVSEEIARKTYEYRTIGLGYANVGSLLMRLGIAYGSNKAANLLGCITSIMTGSSYLESNKIARKLSAFPAYNRNADSFSKVMNKHYNATLSLYPHANLDEVAKDIWKQVTLQDNFRNAQTTVIAPTGTISLVMDCDTSGIEPDFSLIKMKKLAGGGHIKLVNSSVPQALTSLGYGENSQKDIIDYLFGHGKFPIEAQAQIIAHEDLLNAGVSEEIINRANGISHTKFDLYTLINHIEEQSGIDLGFMLNNNQIVDNTHKYIYGHGTIEGCPALKKEDLKVFACAVAPAGGSLVLEPQDHLNMVAAAQPFVSGGISKTINMPEDSTVQAISDVYWKAYDMGIKCVSVYRDGSKLSQPLMASVVTRIKKLIEEISDEKVTVTSEQIIETVVNEVVNPKARNRLPAKRRGYTQKASVGGENIYIRTGEYPNGKIGEIFLDMHKEGAAFRAVLNNFAIAVSLGLQYGVPLEEFVEAFIFSKFEPSGFVSGHENIKSAQSIIDYIFRDLAINYLGRNDLAHVTSKSTESDKVTEIKETSVDTQTTRVIETEKVVKHITITPKINTTSGESCPNCRNFTLIRSGTCFSCTTCGSTTGCA